MVIPNKRRVTQYGEFLAITRRAEAVFSFRRVANRSCSALHSAHSALLNEKVAFSSGGSNSIGRP